MISLALQLFLLFTCVYAENDLEEFIENEFIISPEIETFSMVSDFESFNIEGLHSVERRSIWTPFNSSESHPAGDSKVVDDHGIGKRAAASSAKPEGSCKKNEVESTKREKRASGMAGGCRYPKKTCDSELVCKIYPSTLECRHTCMYGFRLREGVRRIMTCDKRRGIWGPSRDFEKCKPYVDCSLTLGPGANMQCWMNYMTHGPICEISCKRFEDKPAIPKSTFQCNNRGRWSPQLPHCVRRGSGMVLVPAPPDIGVHDRLLQQPDISSGHGRFSNCPSRCQPRCLPQCGPRSPNQGVPYDYADYKA